MTGSVFAYANPLQYAREAQNQPKLEQRDDSMTTWTIDHGEQDDGLRFSN